MASVFVLLNKDFFSVFVCVVVVGWCFVWLLVVGFAPAPPPPLLTNILYFITLHKSADVAFFLCHLNCISGRCYSSSSVCGIQLHIYEVQSMSCVRFL